MQTVFTKSYAHRCLLYTHEMDFLREISKHFSGKHYIHIMWCVGSTSYDVDISWWDIKILGSHHFLIFEETSLWCEPKWCVKLPSYVHITFFHPHHFLACLQITFPRPIKTRSVVSPTSKIPKVCVPLGFSWYIGHDTKVCPSPWEQEQLHEQQGHPLAVWQVLPQKFQK